MVYAFRKGSFALMIDYSFNDLSNPEKYDAISPMVQGFIDDVINKVNPDLIIAVHRKGRRVLTNFLSAQSKKIMVSDSFLDVSSAKDKTVLIFDDSMHYGNTVSELIKKLGDMPTVIHVSSILGNEQSIAKLCSMSIDKEKIHLMKCFSSYYEGQSDYFHVLFPLIEASNNRLGNGYPSLHCEVSAMVSKSDEIVRALLESEGFDVKDDDASGVMKYTRTTGFTAYPKINLSHLGISMDDDPKIRAQVVNNEHGSEIILEAMFVPSAEYVEKNIQKSNLIEEKNLFCHLKNELCSNCLKALNNKLQEKLMDNKISVLGDTILPPYEVFSENTILQRSF